MNQVTIENACVAVSEVGEFLDQVLDSTIDRQTVEKISKQLQNLQTIFEAFFILGGNIGMKTNLEDINVLKLETQDKLCALLRGPRKTSLSEHAVEDLSKEGFTYDAMRGLYSHNWL